MAAVKAGLGKLLGLTDWAMLQRGIGRVRDRT